MNASNGAKLIGLTGTNGAGKGEAASFFKDNGFESYSLSDLIREELKKRGTPITRSNLIRTGNELRLRFGSDILARRVMERIKGKAVIDSIRNISEVEYFRQQSGFILLAIDAPAEIRFQRVKKRGRDESAETLQEFLAKEKEEMGRDKDRQQIQECMAAADFLVINDGTIEDFRKKLEKFL